MEEKIACADAKRHKIKGAPSMVPLAFFLLALDRKQTQKVEITEHEDMKQPDRQGLQLVSADVPKKLLSE